MMTEFQLWRTWQPVIVGDGPSELIPKAPFHNLAQLMYKFLFFKQANIAEFRQCFNLHSGVYMFVMQDQSETHPCWKQHPPPDGYKINTDPTTAVTVVVPQEHTYFLGTTLVMK